MKFAVVVFPGSNCDHDCYHVAKHVMGQDTSFIWHKDHTDLSAFDCIIVPGGFSYGDYLRPGSIATHSPIMQDIVSFAGKGKFVIGICNGFQILTEAGLLPGVLMRNRTLRFICRDVELTVENKDTPFTSAYKEGQVVRIPIAHHDGNYFTDENTLKSIEDSNQVIFRYTDKRGEASVEANPNGSLNNIAGICNKEKNVLGMMPHPERCAEKALGNEDGKAIFESIVKYLS
ncbi:MAG: phosphoribosylformylglycinamidine synthase subunit PurQ [Deltaproteobacteria bacterium]|nr:phosphoribosylformylglycinamidine synthase subunit PurQ [Deltaproteobacteria bacterium]